jgi:hypothetical protein
LYPVGSIGSETAGRRLRVFEAYIEAREAARNGLIEGQEAMSTSDFPTYIGSFLRHAFLDRYNEIAGAWQQYTGSFSVEDFEEYTSSRFGRFGDISEKPLNGPYDELAIAEQAGPSVKLREWGNSFALTRQLVLSDRMNQMAQLPSLLAEALARTISKEATNNTLEDNPTMYDGNALFSVAHSNLGSTALTADTDGMYELQAVDLALIDQTDPEGYPITTPDARTLIIPTELKWVARAINNNALIPEFGGELWPNETQGFFSNIIIDPFLADANNWYVASGLTGSEAFMVQVNLNGNTTPFLGVQNPEVRGVLGGDDPYSFDFDEIRYKIRHDFAFKCIEWRYIYGEIVA